MQRLSPNTRIWRGRHPTTAHPRPNAERDATSRRFAWTSITVMHGCAPSTRPSAGRGWLLPPDSVRRRAFSSLGRLPRAGSKTIAGQHSHRSTPSRSADQRRGFKLRVRLSPVRGSPPIGCSAVTADVGLLPLLTRVVPGLPAVRCGENGPALHGRNTRLLLLAAAASTRTSTPNMMLTVPPLGAARATSSPPSSFLPFFPTGRLSRVQLWRSTFSFFSPFIRPQ
jgi:hypothetical protein